MAYPFKPNALKSREYAEKDIQEVEEFFLLKSQKEDTYARGQPKCTRKTLSAEQLQKSGELIRDAISSNYTPEVDTFSGSLEDLN